MSINAIIINRDLLSPLQHTVEFLRKEPRIDNIYIIDQASTYQPLLDWYKTIPENVYYCSDNHGPHHAWDAKFYHMREGHFILTDPDCDYTGVPEDWLDKMLEVLDNSPFFKVGFSLRIDDLPDTEVGRAAFNHESQFWKSKTKYGWDAHIDTTFALYRPNSAFSYDAIRLDKPYCIKHLPWYLKADKLSDEWKYYLDHCSYVSTWGNRIKLPMSGLGGATFGAILGLPDFLALPNVLLAAIATFFH